MTTADKSLEERLETGWVMIEAAKAESRHADAETLTDHWLRLLARYEEEQDNKPPPPPPATAPLFGSDSLLP